MLYWGKRSEASGEGKAVRGCLLGVVGGGVLDAPWGTGGRYGPALKWQRPKVCHCEEAKGRRGALSAKREEVPLGCNLAGHSRIAGKPSVKTKLPSRDCHGPFGASQ